LCLSFVSCNIPNKTIDSRERYSGNVNKVFYKENAKKNTKGNFNGSYSMISEKGIELIKGEYEDGSKIGNWIFNDRLGNRYLEIDYRNKRTLKSRIEYNEFIG